MTLTPAPTRTPGCATRRWGRGQSPRPARRPSLARGSRGARARLAVARSFPPSVSALLCCVVLRVTNETHGAAREWARRPRPRVPTAQRRSARAAPMLPAPAVRGPQERQLQRRGASHGSRGEKDAELAQKLGQLQPFVAVLPQECVCQLASSGPT